MYAHQMCIRDRLRGSGSLPATFYVLIKVKYIILIKYPDKILIIHCRNVDEISINEEASWTGWGYFSINQNYRALSVSYTHLDVYKRQNVYCAECI